jgi:hypothetical protein
MLLSSLVGLDQRIAVRHAPMAHPMERTRAKTCLHRAGVASTPALKRSSKMVLRRNTVVSTSERR